MNTKILLFGVLGLAILLPVGLRNRSISAPAAEWYRGPKGPRQIALTFDAGGEGDGFPQLLQALVTAKVRCTFFVTGRWAQDHPDFVRQLAQNGHEIGNHTWSHPDLTRLSDSSIAEEIKRTDVFLIGLLGQKPPRLFRAPFGSRDARVLAAVSALGFQPVYWSLDSLDSVGSKKDPRYLFDRVAMRKETDLDGAIVLMHVGEASTATAVPYLIQALQAREFRLVTVSRMMGQSL